jgi:DNA-damage-inducible protein J
MKRPKTFDLLCDDMGMNACIVVTIFAKTVVRKRRIPFAIASPENPFWGEANQAHLQAAIADINAGKHRAHELIETADD